MLSTEKSRAYYDPQTNAAIGVFIGYLTPDEFKVIANELLNIQATKKVHKQINDVKQMKVTRQEIKIWLDEVWFPQAEKNGLKYFAFVMPENIYDKMRTEGINKEAESKSSIEIQYFNTMPMAKQWLNSKK